MSSPHPVPKVINVLLGLGVAAIVLMIALAMATPFLFYYMAKNAPTPNVSMPSGMITDPRQIGQLGVACGGPEMYPCIPGTKCSVAWEKWATEYGTCVPDPDAKPAKPPMDR